MSKNNKKKLTHDYLRGWNHGYDSSLTWKPIYLSDNPSPEGERKVIKKEENASPDYLKGWEDGYEKAVRDKFYNEMIQKED